MMRGRSFGTGRRHSRRDTRFSSTSEEGGRFAGSRERGGWQDDWRNGQDRPWDFGGRQPLYRARDGKVMGVCKGLARYFDMRVGYMRAAFVLGALFSGVWPALGLYVVLGLIIKPEPVLTLRDVGEQDFYAAYVGSRREAVSRLRDQFDRVERRIRRMEDVVTSREFDWERRFTDHTR